VACSNGYGHIRRLLLLSVALRKCSALVVLFAPLKVAERLSKTERINLPVVVDFDSQTKKSDWFKSDVESWIARLPCLSGFDIVVSDNLIEILKIRPDAWLSGSFFWHESLDGFPDQLKNQSRKLLREYHPRMISSRMFSSDKLYQYTNLYEVGLYSSWLLSPVGIEKQDALIACGLSGAVEEQTKCFVKSLVKTNNPVFERVWVDPILLPANPPSWMLSATFSSEMFKQILVAVIRPGVGTITNALTAGARVFSFYEQGNSEMSTNAYLIQSSGVGIDALTIDNAWNEAKLFKKDSNAQQLHSQNIECLDLDGANQAAEIIMDS